MRAREAVRSLARAPGAAAALAVRGYQMGVSPFLGPRCRFYPSCSSYAVTAFRRHGRFKGRALPGWRLARCQPFNPGGVDHVPVEGSWRAPEWRAPGPKDEGTAAAGDTGPYRRVTDGLA
jgi:putative membrane protein insertion efficiency factor